MNEAHTVAGQPSALPAGSVAGLLAIELAHASEPMHAALGQAEAARLVACLGRDLAGIEPRVREMDLCLAAAHFDPAEALRPGWPLHRRLDELLARAPAAAVAGEFEARLLDHGMAAADTALLLQEAFGARIEHARSLTLHDLLAMVALQYDHLGLAPLWPLLETALLSPAREAVLD